MKAYESINPSRRYTKGNGKESDTVNTVKCKTTKINERSKRANNIQSTRRKLAK
jgi:hypothetical protein